MSAQRFLSLYIKGIISTTKDLKDDIKIFCNINKNSKNMRKIKRFKKTRKCVKRAKR